MVVASVCLVRKIAPIQNISQILLETIVLLDAISAFTTVVVSWPYF
jgi:hypothetical protein